ncbi:MAG: S9 family peptidase [Fretibacterium sp.]|nr:S9 family peptidase [Fretibacterium sp.]
MNARVEFHDLLKYRFLSSPRIAPDGRSASFAVHRADLEENRTLSDLWVCSLETGDLTQLTHTGAEKVFCWDARGEGLLFVSARERQPGERRAGEGSESCSSHLYSIPLKGGEARFQTTVPRSVTELWALDDDRLLLKTVRPGDEERLEGADYEIFTQIPFCANGRGFTGQSRTTLSILSLSSGALTELSPKDMDVGQVRLSKDRTSAVVVAAVYREEAPVARGVWRFDLADSAPGPAAPIELLQQRGWRWTCADSFAGGLVLTGTDMKRHGYNENQRFYLERDGELFCLTPELDRGLRNSVVCDCRYGLTEMAQAFLVDGPRVWFVSTDGYRSHLHTLDEHGGLRQVTEELRAIDDYDVLDGSAVVVGLKGLALQELYLVRDGVEKQLTNFNGPALAGKDLSAPEHVRLENGTPEGLDCWYMRPLGFEVGKKYPTLLHIHGGPKMAFGDVFVHEMQCWAAEGFVVLFCNPRGSDGKGDAFADIRGRYGTVDYDDLMFFTDWAVEMLPFVDRDRMGVTGGSYGGFMTNWIVGHTDRFRAAVTQRGICNWVSMAGLSDIGYFFVPDQQGADLWSDVEKLWWHSPLKYADQVRTPTLIIHSDEDYRCELSQGLQFFTALRRNGAEVRICVFKGENHELSRSGSPSPRLARLREIVCWFKEKL